jgi:hypothetical protein
MTVISTTSKILSKEYLMAGLFNGYLLSLSGLILATGIISVIQNPHN